MHILLDSSLIVSDARFYRDHAEIFEDLIIGHRDQKYILCASIGLLSKIDSQCQLGNIAKSVLRILNKKNQDYFSSLRLTRSKMVIVHPNSNRIPTPHEYLVPLNESLEHIQRTPSLQVENIHSDGKIYNLILSRGVAHQFGSHTLTKIRIFHGGGNPLGRVVMENYDQRPRGLCICDRDKTGIAPPFKAGSTAQSAYNAFHRRGIVDLFGNGLGSNFFFKFRVTPGYSLENLIGPNLLFEVCTILGESEILQMIFTVFDNFPNFDPQDFVLWNAINFRDAQQSYEEIDASIIDIISDKFCVDDIIRAMTIVLPRSIVAFIADNAQGGRHSTKIGNALDKDLRSDFYLESVSDIIEITQSHLAADSNVRSA